MHQALECAWKRPEQESAARHSGESRRRHIQYQPPNIGTQTATMPRCVGLSLKLVLEGLFPRPCCKTPPQTMSGSGTSAISKEEKEVIKMFFTETERAIFALVNLPEVIKGTLFSRYSRTNKNIRRLFLDEFYNADE